MELETQSRKREDGSRRLSSSSSTVHSSTPLLGFKIGDVFFSSFLCRVVFKKMYLDIPQANLRHGYRCECFGWVRAVPPW